MVHAHPTNFLLHTQSELTVDNVMRLKTDYEDLAYTVQELNLKEDHAASARPGEKQEKGMKNVEFELTPEMQSALDKFNLGEIDWVACKVDKDEKIGCVETCKIDNITQSVTGKVDVKEPRFYLVRRLGTPVGDRTYLVFSCPESSPIRQRMVYSTCKATLLAQASLGGVEYKLLEIRSPGELDDLFVREEVVDEDAGKLIFKDTSKPKAPGRRNR